VVNDDLASAGEWSCSNPLLNRIYTNIHWGVRGNYRSMPTDCPQRDERQGWLGDRSGEAKGETFLFQNAALYAKWIQDIADSQKETGSVPDVAPAYWPIYSDNVTWPSSLILVPGALYDQFGDTSAIELAYPAMVKWMTYMSGFITNNIMSKDRYGDWCVPPEDPKLIHSADPARKTAPAVLGTTYFYYCSRLMERYATLLGKPDDVRRFNELAERLKTAFNRELFKADVGYYDNGSQTAYVLPLIFGMVPAEQRARVFQRLTDKISRESNNHIGTGLIGGQWLMRTLSDNGRPDLAYTVASQKDYPSWGYMVEKGATTVWELWNGDTADPAMNSGNHVMLVGDLVIWFYEYLAGIKSDPAQPGFKHILMRPQPLGDLQWVKATHHSPYGRIASAWRLEQGRFLWEITIPPNSTATVFVPGQTVATVLVNGKPAERSNAVKFLGMEQGSAKFEVESGTYKFEAKQP
jgi:alpha-L-rhamnosidase